MDELESFDLSVDDIKQGDEITSENFGSSQFAPKKGKGIEIDDDIDISQGMIDLDEMNFTRNAKAAKEYLDNTSVNKEIKKGVAEILSDTSPAALQKSIEIDNLMLKYPGMDRALAEQIATEINPRKKAYPMEQNTIHLI